MIELATVNTMQLADFMAAFGDVAEHSPWVAEGAATRRPFADRETMIAAFTTTVDAAETTAQRALIRAHPDLATKAKLTSDSTREQAGAGLDTLTPSEFAYVTKLNERYRQRFGFPFIFAVKGATKNQIIQSFEQRVGNTEVEEFAMALRQVCRIFRFRIEDRVSP